jgi:CBS domain-containing protein
MKVHEIMTSKPVACRSAATLPEAAKLLRDTDCGILPVVDQDEVVGVVTDRDLCLGLTRRDPLELTVAQVMGRRVFACASEDSVGRAMELMAQHQVRRLPVIDRGVLVGVVSINDILLECHRDSDEISPALVVQTLQAIGTHHRELVATG